MKMEQTDYSEMLAFELQKPGNHPKEIIIYYLMSHTWSSSKFLEIINLFISVANK
jgi:hypothetical protein